MDHLGNHHRVSELKTLRLSIETSQDHFEINASLIWVLSPRRYIERGPQVAGH